MSDTVAIIAGAGAFPIHVADEAARQGWTVVGFGLQGWVNPTLAEHVTAYEELSVGQLGRLLERLQAHQVTQAVMAGKVTKDVLFDSRVSFDDEAVKVIGRVKEFSVNGLLGAIGSRLAHEGITLLDSSRFLKDALCPVGVLTSRAPTAEEHGDLHVGIRAARQLAALDVGQTVVVKRTVIVAVEALEGTDATILRAGQLAGAGGVVVKTASPTQDRRFDLPIVGPDTITAMAAAGASCLAVEAGSTLLLDRERLLADANANGLTLVGVEAPADDPHP